MAAELHFLRPQWLLALAPLLLILFGLWKARHAANAWRGLVDAHLLPHLLVGEEGRPRRLPLALLALAWLLGTLALAGPVWERLPQPVFATTAKRVILLDLSPSMNAADLAPSRLARARFEVLDLLAATREGQVALIAFGPDPFIVSPLTGDAQTIASQVPRLGTDLLPVPGPRRTERALEQAGALLAQAGGEGGEVILITDGLTGDGAGARVEAAARALAAKGHRVSVLGVGTADGAPVPDPGGGCAADRSGAIPMARLERGALESLARAGNGRYVDLDPGDRDTLALIGSGGVAGAATAPGVLVEQQGLAADQWREEGPWLLLALLPIAALAFRRGWLLPVLALVLVLPPHPGWALGWDDLWQRPDQQGAHRLAAGDAAAAATRFQDPAWRAAARYRGGDYAGALADLTGVGGAEADYNRANALARLGRFDESIAAYERTLQQAPDHADARANLDLVKALRDQQQQDQPQGQGNQDQKDQKGDKGQQGQKGQEGRQGQKDGQPSDASQDGHNGQQGQGQQQDSGQGAPPTAGTGAPQDAPPDPGAAKPDSAGQQADPASTDPKAAQGSSAGNTGETPPPKPGDLGQGAVAGEPEVTLRDGAKPESGKDQGQADAIAQQPPTGAPPTGNAAARLAGAADLNPQQREQQQAMEAQLRRVPDDPAGLLRQRFLLQQLRREGRLP
jgi:Ca-activated chloride channel family protein